MSAKNQNEQAVTLLAVKLNSFGNNQWYLLYISVIKLKGGKRKIKKKQKKKKNKKKKKMKKEKKKKKKRKEKEKKRNRKRKSLCIFGNNQGDLL